MALPPHAPYACDDCTGPRRQGHPRAEWLLSPQDVGLLGVQNSSRSGRRLMSARAVFPSRVRAAGEDPAARRRRRRGRHPGWRILRVHGHVLPCPQRPATWCGGKATSQPQGLLSCPHSGSRWDLGPAVDLPAPAAPPSASARSLGPASSRCGRSQQCAGSSRLWSTMVTASLTGWH